MALTVSIGLPELMLSTPVHIMNKGDAIKKEITEILKMACAIANSGHHGGIKMENKHRAGRTRSSGQEEPVLAEHLDSWKQNVWRQLKTIKPTAWECFDFGNDSETSEFLFLHVQPSTQLFTINYNLRLPTDTSTEMIETFEQMAHIVTRKDGKPKKRPFCDLEDYLPSYAKLLKRVTKRKSNKKSRLPELMEVKRGDKVALPESKVLQYKEVADGPGVATRIENLVSDYIVAFANHEGGTIVVGVVDKTHEVVGQVISQSDELEITNCLEKCCQRKIWGPDQILPEKGIHWDVHFHYIEEDMAVIEINVAMFFGGVFSKVPESYTLNVEGNVIPIKFADWLEITLKNTKSVPGIPGDELQEKFEELAVTASCRKRVFAMKNCLEHIQAQLYYVTKGLNIQPSGFSNVLPTEYKLVFQTIKDALKEHYKCDNGLVLCSTCLLVTLGREKPECAKGVLFDMLVCTEVASPILLTVVSKADSFAKEYVTQTATHLRWVLGNNGATKFHVNGGAVTDDSSTKELMRNLQQVRPCCLPDSYLQMNPKKLNEILRALVISVSVFRPDSFMYDQMGIEVMNLLTEDQLKALQVCRENRFVHVVGYPGSGKTVIAVERMKELRLSGIPADKILFMCSQTKLLQFISHLQCPDSCVQAEQPLCMVLDTTDDNSYFDDLSLSSVKYLIIDEAQNIEDPPNMWARKIRSSLKTLMTRHAEFHLLVLEDPNQKLQESTVKIKHSITYQYIKNIPAKQIYLSQVIRNSIKIAELMEEYISGKTNNFENHRGVAHDYIGVAPRVRNVVRPELRSRILKYLKCGFSPSDISVLSIRNAFVDAILNGASYFDTSHQWQQFMEFRNSLQVFTESLKSWLIDFPSIDCSKAQACDQHFECIARRAHEPPKDNTTIVHVTRTVIFLYLYELLGNRGIMELTDANFSSILLMQQTIMDMPGLESLCLLSGVPKSCKDMLAICRDDFEQVRTKILDFLHYLKTTSSYFIECINTVVGYLSRPIREEDDLVRVCQALMSAENCVIHFLPNVHLVPLSALTWNAGVVVSEVCHFAGLEKAVVIGDANTDSQTVRTSATILMLASRARARLDLTESTRFPLRKNYLGSLYTH